MAPTDLDESQPMDFVAFLRVILRRWMIALPCLVVTAALVLAAGTLVKPSYHAEGTLVLLGPSTAQSEQVGGGPVVANPLLDLGGLGVVTEVVAQRMTDPDVVKQMVAKGASRTFEVQQNTETRSPLLTVLADAPEPSRATRTVAVVLEGINTELSSLQRRDSQIPANQQIRAEVLREDRIAAPQQGSRVRAMLAVAVVGLIGTLSLVFAVESLSVARRRRRLRDRALNEKLSSFEPAPGPVSPLGPDLVPGARIASGTDRPRYARAPQQSAGTPRGSE